MMMVWSIEHANAWYVLWTFDCWQNKLYCCMDESYEKASIICRFSTICSIPNISQCWIHRNRSFLQYSVIKECPYSDIAGFSFVSLCFIWLITCSPRKLTKAPLRRKRKNLVKDIKFHTYNICQKLGTILFMKNYFNPYVKHFGPNRQGNIEGEWIHSQRTQLCQKCSTTLVFWVLSKRKETASQPYCTKNGQTAIEFWPFWVH